MCDFVCGTMPRAKVALLMAFNPEKCVVIRTAKNLYSLTTSFVVSHFNILKMQNISTSKSRSKHIN